MSSHVHRRRDTQRLRVTIDARMAWHSGIGRYVRGLVGELVRRTDELALSLMVSACSDPGRWLTGGTVDTIPFEADIYSLKEQLLGTRLCRRAARVGSVLHHPHYNVPRWAPAGGVVTIHDLTHFEFSPQLSPLRVRLALGAFRRAVRRAAGVIAVSEATAGALARMIPGSERKTTVIHHGVDPAFATSAEELRSRSRNAGEGRLQLLFVGNAKPHKNLAQLIEAFAVLREEWPELELVLVGGRTLEPYSDLPGVRVRCGIEDAELADCYRSAEALVVPSLNEGFGLPALEAMSCGAAVVASSIPSHLEVLGEAAEYFDPETGASLVEALRGLLRRPARAEELRRRGLVRAAEFRWDRAAERTLAVYRRVAGQR